MITIITKCRATLGYFFILAIFLFGQINTEAAEISCNSPQIKKILLVNFFAIPHIRSGANIDIKQIIDHDSGTFKLKDNIFKYNYKDGQMIFLVSDVNGKNETLTFEESSIRTDVKTEKSKIKTCRAQLLFTTSGDKKLGDITYTAEITDDKQHYVDIISFK